MFKIYSWVAQPLGLSLPRLVFPPTPDKSHRRAPELLADYQKQNAQALHPEGLSPLTSDD